MIKELVLKNYRGFDNHTVLFSNLNIIVGANNAGKSTVVEALRILSLFTNRYKGLSYHPAPDWTNLSSRYYGASPSLKNCEIHFDSICHQYHDDNPAIIQATFENNCVIEIIINRSGDIHGILYTPDGRIVNSKSIANRITLPSLNILPQVAPLQKDEKILDVDYVHHSIGSPISYLHFRNQLKIFYDLFGDFQQNVTDSWNGVLVHSLEWGNGLPGTIMDLQIRNEGFVAEAALMGHGLQMWLQVIWFLTLNKSSSIIILDEPDVYMHADLQKRLIRMIRNKFPQVILTTHSIEIVSEVNAENILIIDKNVIASKFASNLMAVQKIIEQTGSIHNIHLTRLWKSKKIIFIEGKDLKFLKKFQDIIYPNSKNPIDIIPNMSIGGWGGWNYVVGSDLLLKNNFDEDIRVFCLLDSDYHTDKDISKRYKEAEQKKIFLHIWSKKEIENFLIVPSLIRRVIKKNSTSIYPSESEVIGQIKLISKSERDNILDLFSDEISRTERCSSKIANQTARDKVSKFATNNDLHSLTCGKDFIGKLSEWSKQKFKVSFGVMSLLNEINKNEIHSEIKKFLDILDLK